MSAEPSVAELIELVRKKVPEELTEDQLTALRRRLPESRELADVLREQVAFEQFLETSLGRFEVSAEQILARAHHRERRGRRRWFGALGSLAVVLVVSGAWFVVDQIGEDSGRGVSAPPAVSPDAGAEASGDVVFGDTDPASSPVEVLAQPVTVDPTAPDWAVFGMDPPPRTPREDARFRDFDLLSWIPGGESLGRWFEGVHGSGELTSSFLGDSEVGVIRGRVRLRGPWPSGDAILRLGFLDPGPISISLWSPDDGAQFRYEENEWLGFEIGSGRTDAEDADDAAEASGGSESATGRSGVPLTPFGPRAEWRLASRDERFYSRGGRGAIEIGYRDGQVILWRGESVLGSLRLSQRPESVELLAPDDHETVITGVELYRGETPSPSPVEPPSYETRDGAALAWAYGSEWRASRVDRGGMEFRSHARPGIPSSGGVASKTATAPVTATRELVVAVESLGPGVEIVVGNEGGSTIGRLLVGRDVLSGRLFASQAANTEAEVPVEPGSPPRAWIFGHAAFRATLGAATVTWWAQSGQGAWCRLDTRRVPPGSAGRIESLSIRAHSPRSRVIVRSVRLGTSTPTPVALVEAAGAALAESIATLQNATPDSVASRRPENVSEARWLAACAEVAWDGGRPNADRWIEPWMQWIERGVEPPEERLEALARFVGFGLDSTEPSARRTIGLRARRAAIELAAGRFLDGASDAFTWIRPLLHSSLLVRHGDPFPEPLVRAEILAAVVDGRAEDVLEWESRLTYYFGLIPGRLKVSEARRRLHSLAQWAVDSAAQELGVVSSGGTRRTTSALDFDVDKPASDFLATWLAALDEGEFVAASEALAQQDVRDMDALVAVGGDERLAITMPAFVAAEVRARPELQKVLSETVGSRARLRVEEAAQRGDVRALEWAVVSFPGTRAAARSLQWLGDHWLSAGQRLRAIRCYSEALAEGPGSPDAVSDTSGRLYLARSLGGSLRGRVPRVPVRFADRSVSAKEFERTVLSIQRARSSLDARDAPGGEDESTSIRVALDATANSVSSPATTTPNLRPEFTGLAASRDMVFLADESRIWACDRSSGTALWSAADSNATSPFIPRRVPLPLRTGLVVRCVDGGRSCLRSLDPATGEQRWQGALGCVVDPLVVEDALIVLAFRDLGPSLTRLEWHHLDPETGRTVEARPLVEVDPDAHELRHIEWAADSDGFVVQLPGGLVHAAVDGTVRWIRRTPWVEKDAEVSEDSPVSLPLLRRDSIISLAPGSPGVVVVDRASGRRRFLRVVPVGSRLLGAGRGGILVGVGEQLLVLDLADGVTRRRLAFPHAALASDGAEWVSLRRATPSEIAIESGDPDAGEVLRRASTSVDANPGETFGWFVTRSSSRGGSAWAGVSHVDAQRGPVRLNVVRFR